MPWAELLRKLTVRTATGWDQSDRYVKIYISDLKGLSDLKQKNVKSSFTAR